LFDKQTNKKNLIQISLFLEILALICWICQWKVQLFQNLIGLISKPVDLSDLYHRLWINFDNLFSLLNHVDGESSLDRTSYANDKRECPLLNLFAIILPIRLIKEQNMWAYFASTNYAFLDSVFRIVRVEMVLIASNLLAVAVNVVVLVLVFQWLYVQVVNVLSGQCDLFAHFCEAFCQKINLVVDLVGPWGNR